MGGEIGSQIEFNEFKNVPRGKTSPIRDIFTEISAGNIEGMSVMNKFGRAPDFDTTDNFVDIWDGANDALTNAMTYTYSSTADIDTVSSSDATDTQILEIQGLDTNFDLVIQNATLSGQSKVTLGTSLIRVFRIINTGSTDNAGSIYCYVDGVITAGVPNVVADIRAIVGIGNNQTLMALYTIPNGKTGYLCSWYASLSKRQAAICTVKLNVRPSGGVFQIKHISDIHNTGNNHIQHIYNLPIKINARSDISMQSDTSANTQGVSAGFDIVLMDDLT